MKKSILMCFIGLIISSVAIVALYLTEKKADEFFNNVNDSFTLCENTSISLSLPSDKPESLKITNAAAGIAYLNSDGEIVAVAPGQTSISLQYLLSEYNIYVTVTKHKGVITDCDVPFTCELCGSDILPEQEHQFSKLTCMDDSVCELCGHVNERATGHMFTKLTCETDSLCMVCGEIKKRALGHSWNEATCKRPRTCRKCYKTEGEATEHSFSLPTCTSDSACIWCGEPGEEKALGHEYSEATCTLAATCIRCEATKGKSLGHKPGKEVCGQPSTCTRCKDVLSEALEHDWRKASCTKPKTCARCKITEGDPLGHTVIEATCTEYSYCSICNKYLKAALGHDFVTTENTDDYTTYTCTRCAYTYQKRKINTAQYASEVLEIVNAERAANGLSPLSYDATLQSIAQARAVETTSHWSHTRPNGQRCFTMYDEYGYSYNAAGENIAYGHSSAEMVMEAWMNSSGHRANILNASFNRLGVGVYVYNETIYWVQNFSD